MLFRGLMMGESRRDELGIVRHIECVPPLNEVDEALSCVCLQWVTLGFGEEEDDVGIGANVERRWPQVSDLNESILEYCEYCSQCLRQYFGTPVYDGAALKWPSVLHQKRFQESAVRRNLA